MNKPNWSRRRKLLIIAGCLAVLLVVAGGWWWLAASRRVSTDDARIKSDIINVSTKISGQVAELLVKEGDQVEAGQPIAEIDRSALEIQVEQARANLASARAKLAALQAGSRPQQVAQSQAAVEQAAASLNNARRNYERTESLYEDGALSAQQREAAQTALKVAQAQYDAAAEGLSLVSEGATEPDRQFALAQVAQAAAAAKNAQLQLDNAEIKAPSAGIIAQAPVEAGEMVSVGQTICSITNPAAAWVEVNIEETAIGKIRLGQPVDFKVDAYPGQKFPGEVMEIGAATGSQFALLPADNASGNYTKVTQRIPVKVKVLASGNATLKPGMSAVVDIHVG